MEKIFSELFNKIQKSVLKCSSNNIALSGGLDSSIIAYFLKERKPKSIAIIAEDFIASDLTYCQLIAKELNIPLVIKNVKTEELLDAVEQTIKILKNFNDIEIRNSVVMYLVIKYIKDQGEEAIVTGDGADELFAGYNFFLSKLPEELDREQKRIWKTMHFPSHEIGKYLGIKVESPYLSEDVMNFAKTIPIEYQADVGRRRRLPARTGRGPRRHRDERCRQHSREPDDDRLDPSHASVPFPLWFPAVRSLRPTYRTRRP